MTFYERTTNPVIRQFAPSETDILTRLADISFGGDLTGAGGEYYDIFYSDAGGTPNPDGAYVTVEGIFGGSGGFNVTEVSLNFAGSVQEFANQVAAFTLGTGGVASTAPRAADGDLDTHTTFGMADNANRMSVTLGYASSVPEPGTLPLLMFGITLLGFARRRR